MKKTERKNSNLLVIKLKDYIGSAMFIMVAMISCNSVLAQNTPQTITITGSKFANPLIEKWTNEYSKVNSDVKFKYVKSADKSDLALTVNTSQNPDKSTLKLVNVGRVAVLPVTNERNTLFNKELKNGIKQEELKNIFLGLEVDPGEEPAEKPLFTVYTQTTQSATAKVLIDHFGQSTSELNGVIVTGDDKYLIESVLDDSTGVTYGNLGVIYDLNNRAPLKGIKILPIDQDNNGRLKKEELIYNNLDQLITYLESSKIKSIPSNDISFSYTKENKNPLVEDFVNWVRVSGQQYNHQFGFLRANDDKDPTLTQK